MRARITKLLLLSSGVLLSLSLAAQYPSNPAKSRLGYQTTGDGLIFRGAGAPAYSPGTLFNAWTYLDTTNMILYGYKNFSWVRLPSANNGLTMSGAYAQLGGSLNQNTTIESGTYNLKLGKTSGTNYAYMNTYSSGIRAGMYSIYGTIETDFAIGGGNYNLTSNDSDDTNQFTFTPTGFDFTYIGGSGVSRFRMDSAMFYMYGLPSFASHAAATTGIGSNGLYRLTDKRAIYVNNGTANDLEMPFDSITFNPTTVDPDTAELKYSQDLETFVFGADGTTIEIGQKEAWYVKNQTGSTIAKGTVVRASGTLGSSGRILVNPMIANGTVSSKYLLGITASSIANGADGYVIHFGKLRKTNTNSWNEGDVLYASATTPGALTNIEPAPPNLRLPIAFVVHKHATNGVLAVRIQTGNELHELHDVDTSGINTGEGLVYNSTLNKWQASAGKLITAVDTAAMLVPYIERGDTAGMLANYPSTAGWGILKSTKTIRADSAKVASRFFVNSNFFPLQGGTLTGTGGAGFVGFPSQVTAPGTPASGLNVYTQGSSFNWKGTDGYERQFASTLTGGRTYTLPNASGTFALGTGTATRIPIWTSANALGDSPALYNSTTKRWTWDSPSVLELPMGTDAQRPSPATTSDFWYNMTSGGLEWYNGTRWAKALESTINRGTAANIPYFNTNGQIAENSFLNWDNSNQILNISTTLRSRPTATNMYIDAYNPSSFSSLNFRYGVGLSKQLVLGANYIDFNDPIQTTFLRVTGSLTPSGMTGNGIELHSFSSGGVAYAEVRQTNRTTSAFGNTITNRFGGTFVLGTAISTSGTYSFYDNNTSGMRIPVGTTAQTPTEILGLFRYNSDSTAYQGYNGGRIYFATRAYARSLISALPTTNIYTADGTLTGNRTLTGSSFWLNLNSNVGIKQATPLQELDVNGDLRVRDSTDLDVTPAHSAITGLLTRDATGWVGAATLGGGLSYSGGVLSSSVSSGTARTISYHNSAGARVFNTNFKLDTTTTAGALGKYKLNINNPSNLSNDGDAYQVFATYSGDAITAAGMFTVGDQSATMGTVGYAPSFQLYRSGGNFASKSNLSLGASLGAYSWRGQVSGSSTALGNISLSYLGNGTTSRSGMSLNVSTSGGIATGISIDSARTIQFPGYGTQTKEAGDITKTVGNVAAFATDGTVLDYRITRDTSISNADFTVTSTLLSSCQELFISAEVTSSATDTVNIILPTPSATFKNNKVYVFGDDDSSTRWVAVKSANATGLYYSNGGVKPTATNYAAVTATTGVSGVTYVWICTRRNSGTWNWVLIRQ